MKDNKYLYILLIFFICLIIGNTFFIKSDSTNKDNNISSFNNFDDNCIAYKPEIIEDVKEDVGVNYLENQVGYIKIEGTSVDGAIMQSSDNEFYLSHDNLGNYYVYGSIYMDYRNNMYDKKILLFGHNTKGNSNSPLHDLENYEKFSFYKNHPYIDIEIDGKKNKWLIFSVMIVSNKTNKHMKLNFSEKEWDSHLNWLINGSIYKTDVEVQSSDQIITIQTCYYGENDSFILVSAKKEK